MNKVERQEKIDSLRFKIEEARLEKMMEQGSEERKTSMIDGHFDDEMDPSGQMIDSIKHNFDD